MNITSKNFFCTEESQAIIPCLTRIQSAHPCLKQAYSSKNTKKLVQAGANNNQIQTEIIYVLLFSCHSKKKVY